MNTKLVDGVARPIVTLFMLMSVDGKVTTGANDSLDFDRDLPSVPGVAEGLWQYYELEQTTDIWSLDSGRVMAKIGANTDLAPKKVGCNFIVLDNSHLTRAGVEYMVAKADRFILVTSNGQHPAFSVKGDFSIIEQSHSDLPGLLEVLYRDYGCERITLQTGGTLNGLFLRQKLIDFIDIVVAPVLVGGSNVSSLIDGPALTDPSELSQLGILELIEVKPLKNSYVRMRYKVVS